ncbi:hypothetical protein ACWFRF_15520 [Nocardia sp. NPDC055165]
MATRAKLLKARRQLRVALLASEDWQDSYRKDPKTFKALINSESALEQSVAEYFYEQSLRIDRFVAWHELPAPVRATAGPVANNDDPVWRDEEALLTSAVMDLVAELVATGAIAGESIYGIPMGFSTLDEAIMLAARTQVGTLVSNVTVTTRDRIRESIQLSIKAGEDINAARDRILKVVNNPVRAEMIAATESVNSYQTGLKGYAVVTGAISKTWDGLAGACKLCAPLIGQTIPINGLFKLSNGLEVDHPSCHPRDRCGLIYNYP